MAIIGTDEDEDQKQSGGGQIAGSGTVIASGGGGTGESGAIGAGGTGGNAASGQSTGGTSSGSHYTNLQSYLNANQGNAIGSTAGAVAGNMNTAAQDAEDRTAGFSEKATADINKGGGNTGVNQDKLDAITGGTAKADQSVLDQIKQGSAGDSYSGPTSFDTSYKGPSTQDLSAFSAYTGPNDIASFGGDTATAENNAGTSAAKASDQSNAYKNGGFGGLAGLLKNTYQQPTYTAGENSLDAALVGGDSGARATLGASADRQAKAAGSYDTLMTNLGSKIADYKNQAAATAGTYKTAVENAQKDQTAANAYSNAVSQATGIANQNALNKLASPAPAVGSAGAARVRGTVTDTTALAPDAAPVQSGIDPNRNGNVAAPNPVTPQSVQNATNYATETVTNPSQAIGDAANSAQQGYNRIKKAHL